MVKSIVLVAVLLVGLAYSAFFLNWNSGTKVDLVTWDLFGDQYHIPGVPAGFLPIFGAVIGAAVMAIAAWLPWAHQRTATRTAEARLQKAIDKFNEQKGLLRTRNDRIAALETRVAELEATAAPVPPMEAPEPIETLSAAVPLDADAGDADPL